MESFMGSSTVAEQFMAKDKINSFYGPEVLGKESRKDPKKVAAMFEAIFYRILFKNNRETQMEDSIFGGKEMDTMKEMRDDELANNLGAQGSLGILDMVQDFIEKSQGENVISPDKFKDKFGVKDGLLKG